MKTTYSIDLNKIDSCSSLRVLQEEVNKAFDDKMQELKIKEKAEDLSNKSFGYIKESFEGLSHLLMETSNGKKIIANYIDTIKQSDNLSTLHTLYENLRKTGSDSDADYFVSKFIQNKVNKKKVDEDVKKLGNVLGKAYRLLGESADSFLSEENDKLDSAIKFIVENEETKKNLSEYSAAIKILKEDIAKRKNSVNFTTKKDIDRVSENLVKEFNEKYNDLLSDEEKNVVMEIAKSNSPESVFNKYKDICEEKIANKKSEFEKNGDADSVQRMNSIAEQLKNKKYSIETIVEDINNIFELTKIFE